MNWSPEQEDKLIEAWRDPSKSCSQIARMIFGTAKAKSSVIGKAHRMCLGLKAVPARVEPRRAWQARHEKRENCLATLHDLLLKNSVDGYARMYLKTIIQYFGVELKSYRVNEWLETLQERGKIQIVNHKTVPKVIRVFRPKPVSIVADPLPATKQDLHKQGLCWCGKTRLRPYSFCETHKPKRAA